MKRHSLLGVVVAAAALMVLVPWMTTHQASAAGLLVTTGPVQVWTMATDPPALPALAVGSDLVAATEPAEAGAPDDVDQPAGEGGPATADEPGQSDPSAAPGEVDGPDATPEVDLTACGDLRDYDEVVYGTRDDDELSAGEGRKILVGLRGDDVLRGGDGDDCLLGGNGDDELAGGVGDDYLDGGNGYDVLEAGLDPGDVCVSGSDELVACGPIEEAAPVDDGVEQGQAPAAPGGDSAPASGGESPAPEPASSAGKDSGAESGAQGPSEAPSPDGAGPLDTVAESGEAVEDSLTGE